MDLDVGFVGEDYVAPLLDSSALMCATKSETVSAGFLGALWFCNAKSVDVRHLCELALHRGRAWVSSIVQRQFGGRSCACDARVSRDEAVEMAAVSVIEQFRTSRAQCVLLRDTIRVSASNVQDPAWSEAGLSRDFGQSRALTVKIQRSLAPLPARDLLGLPDRGWRSHIRDESRVRGLKRGGGGGDVHGGPALRNR